MINSMTSKGRVGDIVERSDFNNRRLGTERAVVDSVQQCHMSHIGLNTNLEVTTYNPYLQH